MAMKNILSICAAVALQLCCTGVYAQVKVDDFKDSGKIALVAHRGFWNCAAGGGARNSVAALKAAQDNGFWGSEFDVNMTSDEVLVVAHGPKIGDVVIQENPFSVLSEIRLENGEPVPTLKDYLEQAVLHPETVLVLEMKKHDTDALEDRAVELTLAQLEEYGLLDPAHVCFISFSMHACKQFVKLCPGFTVQYLGSDKLVDSIVADGIPGIDSQFMKVITPGAGDLLMKKARERGLSVNVWTVDNEVEIKGSIKKKVDMITTNEPLKARAILVEMGVEEVK